MLGGLYSMQNGIVLHIDRIFHGQDGEFCSLFFRLAIREWYGRVVESGIFYGLEISSLCAFHLMIRNIKLAVCFNNLIDTVWFFTNFNCKLMQTELLKQ